MPDEVKVVIAPEEVDTSQEKVEVVPEVKASVEDQLAAKIKDDFEKLYGSRLKQTEDRLHGAQRINERLTKDLEQFKAKANAPSATLSTPSSTDPWAGIENGQVWKAEIEKLASQKAEEILKQQEAERQSQTYLQQQVQTLDASKRSVIAKYPDLDPEAGNSDTPISKAYVSVLAEHPDWLVNPYGPTLAMYAMEEKLKSEAATAQAPGKSRLAAATLTPARLAPAGGERMTLTREQKAFCDRHLIKYEDYLKTAAAVDQGMVEA